MGHAQMVFVKQPNCVCSVAVHVFKKNKCAYASRVRVVCDCVCTCLSVWIISTVCKQACMVDEAPQSYHRRQQGKRKGEGGRWRYFSPTPLIQYWPPYLPFSPLHVCCGLCTMISTGRRVCACERNIDACLDVQARGFYMSERGRQTDRQGGSEAGSIPGGIQTASVLCDRDGDDFIRPASFSLSLSPPTLYPPLSGGK